MRSVIRIATAAEASLRRTVQRLRPLAPRRIPFVQQLTQTDCGAACLAMVIRYYGRGVTLSELRLAAVSGRDATSAHALVEAAARQGLIGKALSIELDELRLLSRGAILHWNFTHFVVLDTVTGRGARVLDPSIGRRHVSTAELRRSFTGVAVELEPGPNFQLRASPRGATSIYVNAIFNERTLLLHIIGTSALLQAFGLAMPFANKTIIDRVVPFADHALLSALTITVLAVAGAQFLTASVRAHLLVYLRSTLDATLTSRFLDHLLDLPYSFFSARSSGDLLTRLGSNAAVREILTGMALSAPLDGSLALGYIVVLAWLNAPMAAIAMAFAGGQATLFFFTRHRQRQLMTSGLAAQAKSQGYLVEMLSGIETLKSVGAEREALERWSKLYTAELNVSLSRGKLDAWLDSLATSLRSSSTLVLLAVGAEQVLESRVTLGEMVAMVSMANGFLPPVLGLVASATRLQMLSTYLERINDVLDTPRASSRQGTVCLDAFTGHVSAERIWFRYDPASPFVVRDVTLEVKSGQFIALVGRSGSGKSTLARLLLGLYPPTHGRISFDGRDRQTLTRDALRGKIGVVTQQAQLFGGTVRSNIALLDPAMPLEAIIAAAKIADIHDEIMAMPMGYDTVLGDRASSLSGGQQQRLSLARAVASRPALLVLDEATNQLDAASEARVSERLAALECTRIVIAHRLSTVRHADRIVVVGGQGVSEQGTHDELLSRSGDYRELVAAQLGES